MLLPIAKARGFRNAFSDEQFLQLQKSYKNDPEYQTSVDLLAFRHEGWRLSASKEEQLECLSHLANRLAVVFGA